LIQTKSGVTRYIIANACRVTYNGKEAIQSVIYDITEIKNQKEIIEKSLREKETLLTEIHHRVKNNLAIISGLLELQIQTIKDEGTIETLRDSQNRIQSIALVHQQLYQFE
jgi:two-component sensor histidine kinase